MTYHLHEHGQVWTMHRDEHPASTMLFYRWKLERDKQKKEEARGKRDLIRKHGTSLYQAVRTFFAGVPHVVTEGIPGLYYYLKGRITGGGDLVERLAKELPSEYLSQIEGFTHGGMAEQKRKELTPFRSKHSREAIHDTHEINARRIAGFAFGIGSTLAGGYLGYRLVFPSEYISSDLLKKYPKLAEMRTVIQKGGLRTVSRKHIEQMGQRSPKGRIKSLLKYNIFNPVKGIEEQQDFRGLLWVYNPNDIYIENPQNLLLSTAPQTLGKVIGWGNWPIGTTKVATWEYFKSKGVSHLHAPSLTFPEFQSMEAEIQNARIQGLHLSQEQRMWARAMERDALVFKADLGAESQAVWFGKKNLPSEVSAKMAAGKGRWLVQPKLDLASEYRVITVGNKAVYSAHRWGPEWLKKLGLWARKNIKDTDWFRTENIIPVLGKTQTRLHTFAEEVASKLPYEIGALDIGLTKEGRFYLLEAQRTFGTMKNPIASRRIYGALTGKTSGFAKGIAALGAGLAYGLYSLFSGRDDNYNTIEGLSHKGLAAKKRREMTDFGSGFIISSFGSKQTFLQIDKATARQRLMKQVIPFLVEDKKMSSRNGGMETNIIVTPEGQLLSNITYSRKAFGQALQDIGLQDLTQKQLTQLQEMSFWHEGSEIFASSHLFKKIQKGRSPQQIINLLEKITFGSHRSPAVIVDEILGAMKQGPEAFHLMKKFRYMELSLLQDAVTNQYYSRPILSSFQKYIHRTKKIYTTMEKKWLPKFTEPRPSLDKTSKFILSGTDLGLSSKGLSGSARFQRGIKAGGISSIPIKSTGKEALRVPNIPKFPSGMAAQKAADIAWDNFLTANWNKVTQKEAQAPVQVLKKLSKSPFTTGTLKWLTIIGIGGFLTYHLISGKDDNYNKIEGLQEIGLSSAIRKQKTDFGSGYMGKFFGFIKRLFMRKPRVEQGVLSPLSQTKEAIQEVILRPQARISAMELRNLAYGEAAVQRTRFKQLLIQRRMAPHQIIEAPSIVGKTITSKVISAEELRGMSNKQIAGAFKGLTPDEVAEEAVSHPTLNIGKGMKGSKRNLGGSGFGSPFLNWYGSLSKKVSKYLATGAKEGTGKLLDPRKAAKMAEGKSLEEFAKILNFDKDTTLIVRSAQHQEQLPSRLKQLGISVEQHRKLGGVYVLPTTQGKDITIFDIETVRQSFTQMAKRRGLSDDIIQRAIHSEDFTKTVLYHEHLERQVARSFTTTTRMPTQHMGSQVVIGEGGFVDAIKNQDVKQLFTTIRKARKEEYAAFTAGIEGFSEGNQSAILRKLITDFGSGYRGLLSAFSKSISRGNVYRHKIKNKMTFAAQELQMAQKELWQGAISGGKNHTRRRSSRSVRHTTRFAKGVS